ncbi:MAG: BLUF domain-containing protein [Gluconacetobacter diazotrophicus]|nr:BLUF domain-containing protein [Gluconacetobacter diazotrophicus]
MQTGLSSKPTQAVPEPGGEELLHLVYASVAAPDFTGGALDAMVEQSRRRNAQDGITAMLLYQEGTFLHALEGRRPAVQALFTKISADARHDQIQVLAAVPVARRLFAGQAMGFHRFDEGDIAFDLGGDDDHDLPTGPDHLSWRACLGLRLLARFRTNG